MLNKFASVLLITALICTLSGTSAFANNTSNPNRTDTRIVPAGAPAKKEVKPNEQLKTNMLKLVADAKEGKVAPAERPQILPAKRNNLSKGKKIAIGVAIAVAVVAVVIIVYRPGCDLCDR